jgi:hypothetical protein
MWFAVPSNICIKFEDFGLNWRQKAFGKIQDGVPLKLKNAQQPMQHFLICIAFYYFGLHWRQRAFEKIQDGVPLKF